MTPLWDSGSDYNNVAPELIINIPVSDLVKHKLMPLHEYIKLFAFIIMRL